MANKPAAGVGAGTATAAAKDRNAQGQDQTAVNGITKGDGTYEPSKVRDPFTVVMHLDRVTKNAVRYQEEHASDTEPDRIGQLYMQKHNWPKGAPNRIVVTVGRLE